MVTAIIKAFALLAKKPQLLLIAAATAMVTGAFLLFLEDALLQAMFTVILFGGLTEFSLKELPFKFCALYGNEASLLAAFSALSMLVNFGMIFAYTRFVGEIRKGTESVSGAIGFAFGKIGEMVKLLFFYWVLGLFLFVVGWILVVNFLGLGFFGLAVLLVYALFLIVLFLSLLFTPVIMAAEEIKMREALKKSWKFFWKHVFGIIFLLAIPLAVILGGLFPALQFSVGSFLADLFGQEILFDLTLIAFTLVAGAFSTLVFPLYYYSKEESSL